VVHGGVRHARSEGSEGVVGGVGLASTLERHAVERAMIMDRKAMRSQKLFGPLVCLTAAAYYNVANAGPTRDSKAEAVLAGKGFSKKS
jgi:hypothetical protein